MVLATKILHSCPFAKIGLWKAPSEAFFSLVLSFRKRRQESGFRKRLKKKEFSVSNAEVSESNATSVSDELHISVWKIGWAHCFVPEKDELNDII